MIPPGVGVGEIWGLLGRHSFHFRNLMSDARDREQPAPPDPQSSGRVLVFKLRLG